MGWWMTMTEADRNKMPVVEKRESMIGYFPERNVLFLTFYTVCMYVGRQQLRWWSRWARDCGVAVQQPVVVECETP